MSGPLTTAESFTHEEDVDEDFDEELSDSEVGVTGRAGAAGAGSSAPGVLTGADSDDEDDGDETDVIKEEATLRQGWLMKRSKNRMVWKKRWCVLRKSRLCLYKDEEEYKALKIIKMSDAQAQQVFKHKDRVFKLVTPKRKIFFKAGSSDEMHAWVGALNVGRNIRSSSNIADDDEEDEEVETQIPLSDSPPRAFKHLKQLSHDESHSEGEYDSDTGVTPSSATAPKPPAAATDTDTVIKAGYLFKKGHVNKRWKKRWFVLRSSGQLCYYKTEEEYELLQILKLKDCVEIGQLSQHKRLFAFQINTHKREYTISAQNEDELTIWLQALQTEFSKAGVVAK